MNGKELIRTGVVGLALVAGAGTACKGSGGNGGSGGSTTSATTSGATTSKGATTATTGGMTATTGAATTGATVGATTTTGGGTTPLVVKNYLGWCNVAVNGAAPSGAMSQTVNVAAGNIPLTATPLTGFKLGANMWHHTSGDTGTGEAGMVTGTTSAATAVVVSGTQKCVWVCCPFTNGTGCDGLPDQCP